MFLIGTIVLVVHEVLYVSMVLFEFCLCRAQNNVVNYCRANCSVDLTSDRAVPLTYIITKTSLSIYNMLYNI